MRSEARGFAGYGRDPFCIAHSFTKIKFGGGD